MPKVLCPWLGVPAIGRWHARARRAGVAVLLAAAFSCWLPSKLRAEDVTLMAEPIGFTDVADAADGEDPIDVNVQIGFKSLLHSSIIQREVVDQDSGDGREESRYQDVLAHERVQNELVLGLEVGVFHDLMVFARLPIVLGDDQELRSAGASCGDGTTGPCAALVEPTGDGNFQPLFSVGRVLASKQRSGVPGIELGAAWGILNQYRGSHATWVLRTTLGLDTAQPMRACLAGTTCSEGLSDGVITLELESRWSRRFRHVEPMLGIGHELTFIGNGDERFRTSAGAGAGDLPETTTLAAGLALIPWEDRMRSQRFSIEARASAAFVSAGRGASPLFDALGASESPQLRGIEGTDGVPFTGITSIDAHGRLGLEANLVIQAARYVRFVLGIDFGVLTDHKITGAEDCGESAQQRTSSTDNRATACVEGRVSPLYRPVIDAPGQRFRSVDESSVGLSAQAVGQF